MRQMILAAALSTFCALAGCSASPSISAPPYHSKLTLSPAAESGKYEIAFVIEDISDPSNPRVTITSPRHVFAKGEETIVKVGHWEADRSSTFTGAICTVMVHETPDKPTARITTSMMEHGKVLWSDTKTVAMVE